MLIKFLLKIWPAFTPILLYLLWILVTTKILKHKRNFIEGEFQEVNNLRKSHERISYFSLKNQHFVMVIYFSLILMIISFLFFAIRTPKIEKGQYIPAESKDGKIISGKII